MPGNESRPVDILLIHQNFPGQFKFLAPALASQGHRVVAMTMRNEPSGTWQGVEVVAYSTTRGSTPGVHPWVTDFESQTIRGEACFRAASDLKAGGFNPDVIIAHPGWGESLFIKDVWPDARLGIYCEFFYQLHGADAGFDPEFAVNDIGEACRLRLKNLTNILHFEMADSGISPTLWQANTFPEPFRSRITVIHEGIDTVAVAPNPDVSLNVHPADGTSLRLSRVDEVVTFVNRNLEPNRGYHIFMRALPELLRRRPKARFLIVGGDGVSYGAAAPKGETWRALFADEVRPQISDEDSLRVHFLDTVPYEQFTALLQLSTVHVYLTYPFVLSWSLLEAMSAGCAIVASDTSPVREVIQHDKTGLLVDFFDVAGLVDAVDGLLNDAARKDRLGAAARAFVQANYDLQSVCLPRQLEWVGSLIP